MTLTPQRDAVDRAFGRAREALSKLPVGDPVEMVGREASHVATTVVMGACADMMDLGADPEQIHTHYENILANLIVSHALSITGGDRAGATDFAIGSLARIARRCRAYLDRECGDVDVAEPVASTVAGNA